MNSKNPYQAPSSNLESDQIDKNGSLSNLDLKKLKKLYYRSCNIRAFIFLDILGTFFICMAAVFLISEIQVRLVLLPIAIFNCFAIYGILKRKNWGRVLGMICSAFSILNVPIGTIIGIFCFIAFYKCPELFGDHYIQHSDLKAEVKNRKRLKAV